MINSNNLYWIVGGIAFLSVVTFFMKDINQTFVKIDTEHCVALQTAMAQYPHSNADEQFKLDECEALLDSRK